MKKILFGILILVLLVMTLAYFYLPQFIYLKITDFEPFTFEKVLNDTAWIQEYEIEDYRNPQDYGYNLVQEVDFKSSVDGLSLNAWYIQAKKETDSTIFLVHGRTSNRLKTMKYLELFRKKGLDTLYNVFIADMRNSGKSSVAKTYMGYAFSEDIAGGLEYLQKKKDQKYFIIYSFSMGAMATFTLLEREDLNANQFDIQKIIVDSPLSNIEKILKDRGKKMGLPSFVFDETFELLNEDTNGFASKMRVSNLLKDSKIPILFIQSNQDLATPVSHTKEEIEILNQPHIKSWFVDSASHVKIYTNPKYREEYTNRINDFIRN